MKRTLQLVSALGLMLTIAPAMLVLPGLLTWQAHAMLMALGTVLWFAATPFWMRGRPS